MINYIIHIDIDYAVTLNDSNAKILWEKTEADVLFRKRLDGTFGLNRSRNKSVFDRIMAMTYCEKGILTVTDNSGEMVQGSFRKKDLTINTDKCYIKIKFDREDEYSCLDKLADKEFNILANYPGKPSIPIYTAKHLYKESVEYVSDTQYVENLGIYYSGSWQSDGVIGENNLLYPYPTPAFFPLNVADTASWSFYSNRYEWVSAGTLPNTNNFNVTTTWVREVKTIIRLGEEQTPTPPNAGTECDYYEWVFANTQTIDGVTYDKFGRALEETGVPEYSLGTSDISEPNLLLLHNNFTCNGTEYKFTRCRKLNDIITTMIYDCFPNGFISEFFKSTANPISGKDLSNIMLSQKSDCIFELSGGVYIEKGDPATKGIITFKNLMEYLKNEFQAFYAIDSLGNFRIEHKKYWDNNESYTVSNTVDIDLLSTYPQSLIGTNEYTYETNVPIRERFSFMEAWNLDFVGLPISYEDCVDSGEELSYPVSLITTDIDPNFLFVEASKEGFCMFHCESTPDTDGTYIIKKETGILSRFELANNHLSWANLHDAYWKYGRYLPQGEMNGVLTDFDVRPLKFQKPVQFPYCFAEFNPYYLIRTSLGDGQIKKATFDFKTNWFTVDLQYTEI